MNGDFLQVDPLVWCGEFKERIVVTYEGDFASVWTSYPSERRGSQPVSLAKFNQQVTDKEKEEEFLTALRNYKLSRTYKEGKIMNLCNFIDGWTGWLVADTARGFTWEKGEG